MSIVMVQPLRSQLMSSTALTTHHKGGIGAIVGIVAAIAIPFAAPVIAASIGLSGAIGATMGSALVGAGLGAATAWATGGNVAMGALGGGIGGGIAGFNTPSIVGGGGAATGATRAGGVGMANAGGGFAPPSALASGTTTGAGAGATIAGAGGDATLNMAGTGADTFNSAGSSFIEAGRGPIGMAPPSAGTTLSGTVTGGGGSTLANTVRPGGVGMAGTSGGFTAPPSFMDNVQAGLSNMGTAASEFASGLPDKLMSSEALQQGAGKLLTMGVGNAMAGDEADMSPMEQARMADLQRARAKEGELLANRQKVSDAYVQQAASVNPLYYGQQALTEEQNRLNRAQQAGLRNINPSNTGQRTAQVRRNALDKSRLSGFDRGRQAADQKRLQLMQAAQSSTPTGSAYANNISKDIDQYDSIYATRREQEVKDYGGIVKPIADEFFSLDSEAERKKQLEQQGITG